MYTLFIHTYTHTHTCTHNARTHAHAHTHTHTHTHTQESHLFLVAMAPSSGGVVQVECDGCGTLINGKWYRDMDIDEDLDLCSTCFTRKTVATSQTRKCSFSARSHSFLSPLPFSLPFLSLPLPLVVYNTHTLAQSRSHQSSHVRSLNCLIEPEWGGEWKGSAPPLNQAHTGEIIWSILHVRW